MYFYVWYMEIVSYPRTYEMITIVFYHSSMKKSCLVDFLIMALGWGLTNGTNSDRSCCLRLIKQKYNIFSQCGKSRETAHGYPSLRGNVLACVTSSCCFFQSKFYFISQESVRAQWKSISAKTLQCAGKEKKRKYDVFSTKKLNRTWARRSVKTAQCG